MKRFLPDTLAGRVVLLLALALIVANIVALLLLTSEQRSAERRQIEAREIERVAALVSAMESVGRPARQAIARRASGRTARVHVGPVPSVTETGRDPRAIDIAERLAAALGKSDVAVALIMGQRRGSDLVQIEVTIPLEVAEAPRQYLNVTARSPSLSRARLAGRAFVTILVLSLVSVLLVSVVVVRQMTRPLARLSSAARAAGRGDRTARVPEEGPREIREAAAAFNAMQQEIAEFDGERVRMIAAVGHDLRTPMTGLRIRAEMVEDAAQREAMIATLDEMTVMADGLVAYAREGRDAEPVETRDLGQLAADAAALRDITFEPSTVATVRARPVALKRAIGNLLDNALRYGGSAELSLNLSEDYATLTVSDTGPGLPEARLEDVFQPFARGDDSRNRKTGGAGLGLSIARAIVASHGGEVRLENRETGGLDATIRLPLASKG